MIKARLDTGTKYQLLLAAAESGSCYNPECTESLLVSRDHKTIANFEFAHIRDELAPKDRNGDMGWRYWPDDLTRPERNHFSNIALLCGACHKLIDKVAPRSYSVELLHDWKATAEGASGPKLATTVGSMTTDELDDLIQDALRNRPTIRDVRTALSLVILDGSGGLSIPLEGALQAIGANPQLTQLARVIGVEATNHGGGPVSVVSYDLELRHPRRSLHPVLMSPNPTGVNPSLPVRLEPGSSHTWLFNPDQLVATIKTNPAAAFTDVVGRTRLATGEACDSPMVGAQHIPMWNDPDAAAALLAGLRAEE